MDFKKPGGGVHIVRCFTTFRHFSPLSLSIRGCVFFSLPVVFSFCNLKHRALKTTLLITLFNRAPAEELYLQPGATLEPVTIAFGISV